MPLSCFIGSAHNVVTWDSKGNFQISVHNFLGVSLRAQSALFHPQEMTHYIWNSMKIKDWYAVDDVALVFAM